jgi:predicted nucleotidyltransferase
MDPVHSWPAAVAEHIAAELAEVANGRLVAVYLHGSAVLGGWVPDRSDVDMLVVAADEIGETTQDSMVHAIISVQVDRPQERRPTPKLETTIVTAAAARKPGPPWPFLRHVVTGEPATRR